MSLGLSVTWRMQLCQPQLQANPGPPVSVVPLPLPVPAFPDTNCPMSMSVFDSEVPWEIATSHTSLKQNHIYLQSQTVKS
jgi:hypothetical protein